VLLLTLCNLGNHKHNMAVLEKKESEIQITVIMYHADTVMDFVDTNF